MPLINQKGFTMSQSCPISARRIDSNMVRVIAFEVALFTTILIFTQEAFFALVLLFDFIVRTIRKPNYSPFAIVANSILELWGIAPKLCDESPKRFALYLGLIISIFISIFYLAGFIKTATTISVILLICASMETIFDFCIGCKIYYYIQLLKGIFVK